MEKLDKVIAGLEQCHRDVKYRDCDRCGYASAGSECERCLMEDALELLKEHKGIVRCEECEYYVDAPNYVAGAEKGVKICRSPSLDFDTECGDQWMWMPPDGFCSNGVRRGEEVADV